MLQIDDSSKSYPLLKELSFLLASQILLKGYLLLNPAFLARYFPELSNLQALLSQFDSFGTIFGTMAATTFIIVQTKSDSDSVTSSFISSFFWISNLVSLFISGIVTWSLLTKAQGFGLGIFDVFISGYMSALSSVLIGLLSGALIQQRRSSAVMWLIAYFYIVKFASFSLVGWLNPAQTVAVFSLQFSSLVTALFFLLKEFGWAAVRLRNSDGKNQQSYLVYLSENFIGFIRALTPFATFLLLSKISKERGNYPVTLVYAYLFASLCNIPILAGMPVSIRIGLSESLKTAQRFFLLYAAIPTTFLFVGFLVTLKPNFEFFLKYHLTPDERSFAQLFILGCIVGVFGHYNSISLRVHYKSNWLALSFLLTETILQVGALGLLVLFFLPYANGATLGSIILAYASLFSLLTFFLARSLKS